MDETGREGVNVHAKEKPGRIIEGETGRHVLKVNRMSVPRDHILDEGDVHSNPCRRARG